MTFEEFAVSRIPGLLRYAVVLTGDRDLAQDVVQEVLAKTQVRWRSISRSVSPDAYVRRMVVNEYLSWRRRWAVRNIRPVGEDLADIGDSLSTGRDHAEDLATADELWRRLASLPRKQRAVLVLRYYEELDDWEIADLLGCAQVTVRSNASKALHTLRLNTSPPNTSPPNTSPPNTSSPNSPPLDTPPLHAGALTHLPPLDTVRRTTSEIGRR